MPTIPAVTANVNASEWQLDTTQKAEEDHWPDATTADLDPYAGMEVPSLVSVRSLSIIGSTAMAMAMNIGSVTCMFIALPTISRDLNFDPTTLEWLITAYALTSGCFLLLFGRLADIFGRKYVFLAGCAWMIAFTIGCGFSQNDITLIIMRAMTGIGVAAMIPASLGILALTFPPSHARTVAFSVFQAGAPIGGAFGMVMGGVLTQFAPISWRSIFFVIAGIGALVFVVGVMSFPPDYVDKSADRRVDWVGAALVTSGLVLLLFCLAQGEIAPQQWNTPYIIALLVLSILLILAFGGWEHYVETRTTLPPLMRLNLFARGKGRFTAIQAITFFINGSFSTWMYWATLYYQNYLQLSPILTMVRFLPSTVVGFLITVVFAAIAAHVSGHFLIVIGCLGLSGCCLLFALIDVNVSYWGFGFPAAILNVFGEDIIMAGGSLFVATLAEPQEQSLAGGVFNTLSQLGISFVMTITTIVYDRAVRAEATSQGITLDQYATNAPPDILLYGYRRAQWANFAFALFAALVALVTLRGIGVIGHRTPPPADKDVDPEKPNTQESAVVSRDDATAVNDNERAR